MLATTVRLLLAVSILLIPFLLAASSGENCTFKADPEAYSAATAKARARVQTNLQQMRNALSAEKSEPLTVAPREIPIRNFVDAAIIGRLAEENVPAARLTSDDEFVRRIYLDLTGRIPTSQQVRAFNDSTKENKRDALIDELLYSPEFIEKWMWWLGDVVQNVRTNSFQSLNAEGRTAFHNWMRVGLANGKTLKDIAYECIATQGNSYTDEHGAVNFSVRSRTPGGPIQDTYDTMLSRAATAFLGMSHYDCVLCHNGRGHLDSLTLWGRSATRVEAQRMAAFFSRTRFSIRPQTDLLANSWDVMDITTGTYDLNTTFGNRPTRAPMAGNIRNLTPSYRLGPEPKGASWRTEFAEFMVKDPMFARNFANRIWKQIFNMGLVEPVDMLDPLRLDPKNPPPAPWTLQATHPELLERLAEELASQNFDLREFVRVLVSSSAYQLSSRYGDEWKADYLPLFARHYPRRLEGEEVHDAIQIATGVLASYRIGGFADPIRWALQLPDPLEPGGAGSAFMDAFLRGNRDTVTRQQSGSILQQLNLMNDTFVVSRSKVAASPRLRELAQVPSNDLLVDEMWLSYLSRLPSAHERQKALAHLGKATTAAARNAAVEDLAWVCVNKIDFLFSY